MTNGHFSRQVHNIKLVRAAPEVYYANPGVALIGTEAIAFLKDRARELPRLRCRICLHEDTRAPVHEMLIVHHRSCYVRPHMHMSKAESLAVIEGEADLVLLNDAGSVLAVHRMTAPGSGIAHYYRLPSGAWHTLLIRSEWLVFQEVTSGPFDPAAAAFHPMSPDEKNTHQVERYITALRSDADRWLTGPGP